MRRFSKKTVSFILVLVFWGILLAYPPFRNRIRGAIGGLWSAVTVASKEDKIISEDVYDWVLTDLKGNSLEFSALKGKVVFINFWATWCGPCIAEMPSLQKLYNLHGESVHFLFVTADDKGKVDKFLKKGYDIPVYYTETSVPDIFYSKTIPTTFIIDKKGRIVIAKTDAADWFDDDIRSLLGTLITE